MRLPKGMTWAHVERMRAILGPAWFPSGVLLVRDVSTRAGVGGRRGRKRRRAEERKMARLHPDWKFIRLPPTAEWDTCQPLAAAQAAMRTYCGPFYPNHIR